MKVVVDPAYLFGSYFVSWLVAVDVEDFEARTRETSHSRPRRALLGLQTSYESRSSRHRLEQLRTLELQFGSQDRKSKRQGLPWLVGWEKK